MVEILDIAVRSRESHVYLLFFDEPTEAGRLHDRVQSRVERMARRRRQIRGRDSQRGLVGLSCTDRHMRGMSYTTTTVMQTRQRLSTFTTEC